MALGSPRPLALHGTAAVSRHRQAPPLLPPPGGTGARMTLRTWGRVRHVLRHPERRSALKHLHRLHRRTSRTAWYVYPFAAERVQYGFGLRGIPHTGQDASHHHRRLLGYLKARSTGQNIRLHHRTWCTGHSGPLVHPQSGNNIRHHHLAYSWEMKSRCVLSATELPSISGGVYLPSTVCTVGSPFALRGCRGRCR